MRPTPADVTKIDALVDELDREQIGEEYQGRATSSMEQILDEWDLFRSQIERLDRALSRPWAASADRVLMLATELVGERAYRLSFWLHHVGEVIARGRRRARRGQ